MKLVEWAGNKLERLIRWYTDGVERSFEHDENSAKMRRFSVEIGREFETKPYDALLAPAEVLSGSRAFEGATLSFSAEAYRIDRNGDLYFCIDIDGLPTKQRWRPSYRFIKQKDGSVRY